MSYANVRSKSGSDVFVGSASGFDALPTSGRSAERLNMGSLLKTAVFLVFIGIGIAMQLKLKAPAEQAGIKKIILNLALPATIFIALLGVDVQPSFLLLPLLALMLNAILFVAAPWLLPLLGIAPDTPQFRTARLLVPSFAPGLSCFPFLSEYLGAQTLAHAAMADLGNKVFVLVVLYLVAMSWHYRRHASPTAVSGNKMWMFAKTLLTEPVNLFILAALLLVTMGVSMSTLPSVIAEPLRRLSSMMTPLVLLFIGLAVKFKGGQFRTILSILLLRAGAVAWICIAFVTATGISAPQNILLTLVFGLSACSFWPFAHISTVDGLEEEVADNDRTFDSGFAINMLALSFPLSTALILAALSVGDRVAHVPTLIGVAAALTLAGLVVAWFRTLSTGTSSSEASASSTSCAERPAG